MDSISRKFGSWVEKNQTKGLNGYGEEGSYVSEDALKSYWNEDRVSEVLWRAGIHRQPLPPPKSIIQSYIRIFSILVYITTPTLPSLAYLGEFNQRGSNDYNLPFLEGIFPGTSEGIEVETKFMQFQFLFSPVVLNPGLHGRELDRRCVLPLTFERQLCGHFGSSANSVTTKLYRLHKASKLQAKEDLVVIKEYPKSEIEHSFRNELEAYLSFQYPGNEHDVSEYFLEYYGSFKQNEKGFIILEFADEGSLLEFFKGNKVPRTREELRGLFENLSGLLDGLRILHAQSSQTTNRPLRGVHQDLKPANIFVCRNEATDTYKYKFKIGDFGLTSFTSDEANKIKNRDNKGGIMYNAPEMTNYNELSRSINEGISPLVDIWSFGCVLFETAVWAISDERGREEFRRLRCEENDDNHLLRDQGYGASFHDGKGKLKAVDEMLKRILEQRRVFDNITEGFCKLLLKYAMVPVRGQPGRYDANRLGGVFKEYLENAKAPQTLEVPSSPTSITTPPELVRENNPRSFNHPRTSLGFRSVHHNTSTKITSPGGDRWSQGPFNQDEKINENYLLDSPRSSGDLPELSNLNLNPPDSRQSLPLPSQIHREHREPFLINENELTADPEKYNPENGKVIKSQDTERSTQTPSAQPTSYPKFGVQDVIDRIDGGKYRSDGLDKSFSAALKMLNKRQQIFLIDDTADMKKYHWSSVIDTFKALAHFTNKVDPDGIELYFRSSPDQPKKPHKLNFWNGRTAAEKLVDKVVSQGKTREDTICYMQSSISRILNQVKARISQKNSETSIYILTDGIWDDATDSRNICGVDNAIHSLVREMCQLNLGESHISIQFIRFGDSEVAKNRLRYLDDDLAKEFKSYDIVDTTTDRSPVWKMLLGSMIRTLDNAADDCTEHFSG